MICIVVILLFLNPLFLHLQLAMMNMTRRNNNNDVKVGDTPADTVMGKAAGVGLNVGVLRFTVTYRITLLVS